MRSDDYERLYQLVMIERPPTPEERAWLADLISKCSRLGTAYDRLGIIEARMVLARGQAPAVAP